MKRILVAGATLLALSAAQPTLAADAPVYKVPVAVALFNWSGFYVGANAGYAWGRATATDIPGSSGTCWDVCGRQWGPNVDGFTSGLQAGWNVQKQNWVLGIEGDFGYLGLKGSAPDTTPPNDVLLVETRGGWFATLRGRAGVLFSPTVLVYGTGGVIYADTRTTVSGSLNTNKADPWGWTAGGGVETRLGPDWSWKLEYLYYDLGNDRVEGPRGGVGPIIQYIDINQTGHIVRVGLNWKM